MQSRARQLRNVAANDHVKTEGLDSRNFKRWTERNLTDWLNAKPSEASTRVREFIEAAQKAQQLTESFKLSETERESLSCLRRLNPILSQLNTALEQYQCVARVFFKADGAPSLSHEYQFSALPQGIQEARAMAFLVENLAVIHRVRRCLECKEWFFAVTEHQRFCGEKCRKHRAATGGEFKEKRRVYMKAYRKVQKDRDAQASRLARRLPGGNRRSGR